MNHGKVYTYSNLGCRCDACRHANNVKAKRWLHVTRYGEHPIMVDAQPVRDHIYELRASGWTSREIAAEVGVAYRAITAVCERRPKRRSVRRGLAEAILALAPLPASDVDRVVVERLVAGAHWRSLTPLPTLAERIEAARQLSPGHWDRLGLNRAAMERAS